MKGIIFTELVEMVEATFSPELMDEAYSYLKENAGSRFDPKMVDVFIEIREKVESIKAHWDSLDDGGQLSVSWI